MKPHIFPELYVRDVAATAQLFQDIFAAKLGYAQADFAELHIGDSRMLLNELRLDEFEEKNPVRQPGALEHLGAGLELGIYVSNLEPVREKALAANLPYVSEIKLRDWGWYDFRLLLPDGYYIRVTTAKDD